MVEQSDWDERLEYTLELVYVVVVLFCTALSGTFLAGVEVIILPLGRWRSYPGCCLVLRARAYESSAGMYPGGKLVARSGGVEGIPEA